MFFGGLQRQMDGRIDQIMGETFQTGDRVIWWKRIPGGEYVYPVPAIVIALTAKRVKIQADDDGRVVIRFVPPESLQKHSG